MNERRKQAHQALRVYLDRGSKALSSLAHGHMEHANDWLTKREAAFRNFLALEHAANKADDVASPESGWTEMLEAASQQNVRLKRQLADSLESGSAQSRNLSANSRILSRFSSGTRRGSGFKVAG